jgi:uncharacterized membrane protein YcaP (DUF421 family)
MLQGILVQVGLALAYYATLVSIMRLAGKRLAGQTTTFDLVILITISVVLQTHGAARRGSQRGHLYYHRIWCASTPRSGLRPLHPHSSNRA